MRRNGTLCRKARCSHLIDFGGGKCKLACADMQECPANIDCLKCTDTVPHDCPFTLEFVFLLEMNDAQT